MNDVTIRNERTPAPQEQTRKIMPWKERLDRTLPAIQDVLPKTVSLDAFKRTAMTALANSKELRTCMEQDPKRVQTELIKCAQDGLLPDNREATLIAFWSNYEQAYQLTYIPMIRGIISKLRGSGLVKDIICRVVYAEDEFDITYGDEERYTHKPALDGDYDIQKARGAYAIVKMHDGGIQRDWMPRSQILACRPKKLSKDSPWTGAHQSEMWRKTVVKRVSKYLPLPEHLQALIDRDNDLFDRTGHAGSAPPVLDLATKLQKAKGEILLSDQREDGDDDVPPRDIHDDDDTRISEATPTHAAASDQGEEDAPVPSSSPTPSPALAKLLAEVEGFDSPTALAEWNVQAAESARVKALEPFERQRLRQAVGARALELMEAPPRGGSQESEDIFPGDLPPESGEAGR